MLTYIFEERALYRPGKETERIIVPWPSFVYYGVFSCGGGRTKFDRNLGWQPAFIGPVLTAGCSNVWSEIHTTHGPRVSLLVLQSF